MKSVSYFLLIFIVIGSCKGGGEVETVEFSDIAKPSEKYGDADSSKIAEKTEPVYFDSISKFSQRLVDSLTWEHKNIFKLDTLIYPDRFGAEITDKWYYLSAADSLVFMCWEFKTNNKAQNSFFNWLDCYGPKCKSISVNDKVNFSKRATLFLVEGKEIIFIESNRKIDSEKWISILSDLKKQKQWQYFVLQQPKGKASWKLIDTDGMSKDLMQIIEQEKTVPLDNK